METIKINNETLEFNNIIYVDKNTGDDEAGDGSKDNPYKNVHYGIENAESGDCVFIKKGFYELKAIDVGNPNNEPGIFIPEEKDITLIGENPKETILIWDGSLSNRRDGPVFSVQSENSLITNLTIHFYPGKDNGYNSSGSPIFRWAHGFFKNIYVKIFNTGITGCYQYHNNCPDDTPIIENSMFEWEEGAKGSPWVDGGLRAKFINCLYNESLEDQQTEENCVLREITEDDIGGEIASDLEHQGTGENPDGTQAHIGVYGGLYQWSQCLNIGNIKKDIFYESCNITLFANFENVDEKKADIYIEYTDDSNFENNIITTDTKTVTSTSEVTFTLQPLEIGKKYFYKVFYVHKEDTYNLDIDFFVTKDIEKKLLSINPTNLWEDNENIEKVEVGLLATVDNLDLLESKQVGYKIFVNNNKVANEFLSLNQKSFIEIDRNHFNKKENNLKIEIAEECLVEYLIFKENKDTMKFVRRFEYDPSYEKENVLLEPGIGYTLTDTKSGKVVVNIPTDGKYVITELDIKTSQEKSEKVVTTKNMNIVEKIMN